MGILIQTFKMHGSIVTFCFGISLVTGVPVPSGSGSGTEGTFGTFGSSSFPSGSGTDGSFGSGFLSGIENTFGTFGSSSFPTMRSGTDGSSGLELMAHLAPLDLLPLTFQ